MMWDESYERLLCRRCNGTDGGIVIFLAYHVAHVANVPDCCFNLGYNKSNTKFACGSNGNGKRLELLFEKSLKKPICGEFEREVEVEK